MLVTVTKHTRRKGRTLDLAGLTAPWPAGPGSPTSAHVVALHAAIRDGRARRPPVVLADHTSSAKPASRANPPISSCTRIVTAFPPPEVADAH